LLYLAHRGGGERAVDAVWMVCGRPAGTVYPSVPTRRDGAWLIHDAASGSIRSERQ